jgi:hypothetical protein
MAEESEECAKTMPPCSDDEEVPATMPYAEDGDGAAEDCLSLFWKGLFGETGGQEGGQEESEAIHAEDPSPCKEDPAYHHQYPGCPYTGVCPYSGRCATPAVEHEDTPGAEGEKQEPAAHSCEGCPKGTCCPGCCTKKKKECKSKAEGEKKTTPDTSDPAHPKADHPKGHCGDEGCPAHSDVDTMEFRPSDAHEGEFDNPPL